MTTLGRLLGRELLLARRHGGDTMAAILFFVLAASCFPLALAPTAAALRRMAPAILPVCALFASLLPLERLFGADRDDGSLDQLLLAGGTATEVCAAKALAHFATTALPLAVASLPLAPMLALPPAALPATVAALLLAGAAFSLLGTLLATLVLGARRGGVLLPLLLLPLLTPVLVFAAAAIDLAASGADASGPLLLLGAFALAVLLPALMGAAALIRE